MPMVKLVKRADIIYRYVKEKRILTHMDCKPSQALVERVCIGLGFKLTKAGDKTCEVNIAEHIESDPRHSLILAYYSMALTAVFLQEGCLASLINKNKTANLKELLPQAEALYDVFKLESFCETGSLRQQLKFFVKENIFELDIEKEAASITGTKKAGRMLRFFGQLHGALVDTYLIVLLTVEYINGKPMVLPIRKLIKELHASFKELYTERVLPHLHSCLKDVIRTALRRFEQLGFCVMRSFVNKKGSLNTFVQSPIEKETEIQEMIMMLQSVRDDHRGPHEDPIRPGAIDDEIANVIQRMQGPL